MGTAVARVAYQFDGTLSKLGLQGKAVAPILMGFGALGAYSEGSLVQMPGYVHACH